MRIGDVARRTGLTAKMIRYYERLGSIDSPDRSARGHRHYSEDDVAQLRVFGALLAAGLEAAEAAAVVQRNVGDQQLDAAITLLRKQIAVTTEAVHRLSQSADSFRRSRAPEHRMSLYFDVFLASARAEALGNLTLRPVGVLSSDVALLHLVQRERLTPATLGRLVGRAPSTITGQLKRLLERGLVAREPDPARPRSWLITITPAGLAMTRAALDPLDVLVRRLDDALTREGLDPDHVRDAMFGLSTALRRLLPEPAVGTGGAAPAHFPGQ